MSLRYYIVKFSHKKIFWRLRKRIKLLSFYTRRNIFGLRLFGRSKAEEFSGVKYLCKQLILPITLAIVYAVMLFLLDSPIRDFCKDMLDRAGIVWQLNASAYVQLLSTVAAVSGVFLALYFTAVSAVASSIYGSVPNNVRELMVRDRLGNAYVKIIAFLTSLTVILLLAAVLGTTIPVLGLVTTTVLALFSVFAFIVLGQRIFYFSDPTVLADIAIHDFIKWCDRAAAGGWRYKDANFQEHFRTKGNESIAVLIALADIASHQSHLQTRSYSKLVRKIVQALRAYQNIKYKIPSESRWFGRKQEFRQWYLSESTYVETATQTDSPLAPIELPDHSWVEDMLTDSILSAIKNDLDGKRYQSMYEKLESLPLLFEELGNSWDIEAGIAFANKLTKMLEDDLSKEQGDQPNDKRDAILEYAAMDVLASLPLSLELGFIKSLDRISVAALDKSGQKYSARQDAFAYHTYLPRKVIATLEEAHENAIFEKHVGTEHTTPSWYIAERLRHRAAHELQNNWDKLIGFTNSWYEETAARLEKQTKHRSAAAIRSRAMELAWKLRRHVKGVEEHAISFEANKIIGLEWPTWDWSKQLESVKSFREKIIDGVALSIPELMHIERTVDLPDSLGAATHAVGEECFEALRKNDHERFGKLFAAYFLGIYANSERIRPQVIGWEPNSALTWYTEPVIDLMDISGFAYVFAELNGNPKLWAKCTEVWSVYVGTGDEATKMLTHYALIARHRKTLYQLSPRVGLRSNRILRLMRILSKLPTQPPQNFYDSPTVEHDSAFIRKTARGIPDMPHYPEPMDIFVIKYLMVHPLASGIDFGMRRHDIEELETDDES